MSECRAHFKYELTAMGTSLGATDVCKLFLKLCDCCNTCLIHFRIAAEICSKCIEGAAKNGHFVGIRNYSDLTEVFRGSTG